MKKQKAHFLENAKEFWVKKKRLGGELCTKSYQGIKQDQAQGYVCEDDASVRISGFAQIRCFLFEGPYCCILRVTPKSVPGTYFHSSFSETHDMNRPSRPQAQEQAYY